jgi:ethanolamine utilization protein EutQ
MAKLISAAELRELAGDSKQVAVPAGAILTPSAYDLAKEMNLALIRQTDGTEQPVAAGPAAKQESGAGQVQEIVRRVLDKMTKPACANPRLTHVKAAGIVLEPFAQAPPGQKIKLKDVITSREANLGAGFMEFDHSEFPWHLTYDEVDYVVDGTFTLQSGGQTYTCQAGDVLYIPKDTRVVFGSPTQARVFYVTYPANWADLQP